jgi:hypothetical protein
MVLYGDARTHFDVGRHVMNGLSSALAQLGSGWLLLPHIPLVPMVAIPVAQRSRWCHRWGH